MSPFKKISFLSSLIVLLALQGCATHQPPPEPDRSNLHPVNTEQSMLIIREKVTNHDQL